MEGADILCVWENRRLFPGIGWWEEAPIVLYMYYPP